MKYIIETIKLSKKFPIPKSYKEILLHPFSSQEVTALDDISISVPKGEVFGLLGPNGSGKTTLLKILSTLILPTKGKALINGLDVATNENTIKKLIGYVVSDERSFFWRLTGRQNLKFFCSLNNLSTMQSDKKIEEVTGLMGLEREIDKVFQNYSSGNKQKLAIARGLLTDPPILFLDEPTNSLDPVVAYKLRCFIKDVLVAQSRKTVLIATNNMQEADEICDRVAIIHNGILKKCATLKEVQKLFNEKEQYILTLKAPSEKIATLISNSEYNDKVTKIKPGTLHNEHTLVTIAVNTEKESVSEFIEWLVHHQMSIESCVHEELTLNEAFEKCINE